MIGVGTMEVRDPDEQLLIRPIRIDDGPRLQAFVQALSDQSRYFRFMNAIRELPAALLRYFIEIDFDYDMALVAVQHAGEAEETLVAVARYFGDDDGKGCEFAIAVADAWHHHGIGNRLMQDLFESARAHGYQHIHGDVLADNTPMLQLMRHLGFTVRTSPEDSTLKLVTRRLDDVLMEKVTRSAAQADDGAPVASTKPCPSRRIAEC